MPIKQTAQQIAKQIARNALNESQEYLKSAREQVTPSPEKPKEEKKEKPPEQKVDEQKLAQQSSRLKEALDRELEDIRKESLFKDLQKRIAEGEIIPLENYIHELSSEQREVLQAQMEAVKIRLEAEKQTHDLAQPVAKKPRGGMFNMFKKRNEQHVETRQPPSS